MTLRELIVLAFAPNGLMPPVPSVVDQPTWVDTDRFDVVGRALGEPPSQPSNPQLNAMVRTLLTRRFQLALHHESLEMPIYALVPDRENRNTGQLKPAIPRCVAAIEASKKENASTTSVSPNRDACTTMTAQDHLRGGAITMSQLAQLLSNRLNRVVRDQTGLAGRFAIDLTWTRDQQQPPLNNPLPLVGANVPALITALDEQLGLKLNSMKAPVDALVIDHVEKPTPD